MNYTFNETSVNNNNSKISLCNRPPRAQQLPPNKYANNGNEAPDDVYDSVDYINEVNVDPATITDRTEPINNGDHPKVCCLVDLY